MKFVYRVSLFFTVFCLVHISYQFLDDKLGLRKDVKSEYAELAGERKIENSIVNPTDTYIFEEDEQNNSVQTVDAREAATTCDTKYIIEEYDNDTKEIETIEQTIPAQYTGMTREILEKEIAQYEKAPSLSDLEKGFTSAQLMSFSKEQVVIRKVYYSGVSKEKFYIVAENNYITVYYADLNTIYLYTDILLEHLPEEVQQEIMDYKYVESEAELYNFLESYSS